VDRRGKSRIRPEEPRCLSRHQVVTGATAAIRQTLCSSASAAHGSASTTCSADATIRTGEDAVTLQQVVVGADLRDTAVIEDECRRRSIPREARPRGVDRDGARKAGCNVPGRTVGAVRVAERSGQIDSQIDLHAQGEVHSAPGATKPRQVTRRPDTRPTRRVHLDRFLTRSRYRVSWQWQAAHFRKGRFCEVELS
jgi:hypothetical protein